MVRNVKLVPENTVHVYRTNIKTLPILVVLSTSLEGTFLSSSLKASIMFSLGWPGSSRIDLYLSMSSMTTTLLKNNWDFYKNAVNAAKI